MYQPHASAIPALVFHDQQKVNAPQIQKPHEGVRLVVVNRPMTLKDQQILGVFLKLTPSRFFGTMVEDSLGFLLLVLGGFTLLV